LKVINIIGHSCSGKTTFISRLVVKLREKGPVATIKHLGHHNFSLEKGKDTTVFFEHGVNISVGIDSEKTVLSIRNNDLVPALDLLSDQGMEFTVIEGFKTIGLPAVVIGDLESDKVLFRDPTMDEVLGSLEKFPEYYTLNGIVAGLVNEVRKAEINFHQVPGKSTVSGDKFLPDSEKENDQVIPGKPPEGFMMSVSIPAKFTRQQYSSGFGECHKIATDISREISSEYYPVSVSIGLSNCWNFPCPVIIWWQ
jgi:molybdopterin-guanine dinucleotide biosynthesis protein MobB